MADPSGALWWPERRLLVVADLHFEKGSAFAERGSLLPPYDTRTTLDGIERLLRRYAPACVIALGDSFHDRRARSRLLDGDRARMQRMTAATDWVWLAGNHDPEPPADLGGRSATVITVGPLTFRHTPSPTAAAGEICGHLHPKASVPTPQRVISCRCFVTDGSRMVLPAFGAYTGGLDVQDPAIRGLFRHGFSVLLLGRERLHAFPAKRLA